MSSTFISISYSSTLCVITAYLLNFVSVCVGVCTFGCLVYNLKNNIKTKREYTINNVTFAGSLVDIYQKRWQTTKGCYFLFPLAHTNAFWLYSYRLSQAHANWCNNITHTTRWSTGHNVYNDSPINVLWSIVSSLVGSEAGRQERKQWLEKCKEILFCEWK